MVGGRRSADARNGPSSASNERGGRDWLRAQRAERQFGTSPFVKPSGDCAGGDWWPPASLRYSGPQPSNHPMNAYFATSGLLVLSNVFMTFAWYGHLKNLSDRPWIVAALVSWGIALFEYLLQVPANRIGHGVMNLGQLKILQEVITLSVFVPFAIFYMKEKPTLDYLWAGVCLLGAVFFLFRSKLMP
jgi:uncharacterized protein (DUF486 family)